jgi:enoyl-CoA hydratase
MPTPEMNDPPSVTAEVEVSRPTAGIALLRLRAPERRNALTGGFARAIVAALRGLDEDETLAAVVVSGGEDAFCAGAHRAVLDGAAQGEEGALADLASIYEVFVSLRAMKAPTVAAVCGPAVGAGLNLALACDIRMLAGDAYLRSMFLANSIHPAGGHLRMLAPLVGHELATAMAVFDRPVTGAEGAAAGLGLGPFAAAEVETEVLAMVERAAAKPALARSIKASMPAVAELDVEVAAEFEAKAQRSSLKGRSV